MNIADPNDTVKFADKLWRVETRVGGVYQLRAFNADGLGLSDELRLAQRKQFIVTGRAGGTVAAPPLTTSMGKAFPKREPYLTRKREPGAPIRAIDDNDSEFSPVSEEDVIAAQVSRLQREGWPEGDA